MKNREPLHSGSFFRGYNQSVKLSLTSRRVLQAMSVLLIAIACYVPRYGTPPQVAATAQPSPTSSLVAGTGCIPASQPQQATLVSVIDGDTIIVTLPGSSERLHVRYVGIDTPEVYPVLEPYGKEAAAHNAQILKDAETVYLFKDVSNTDRYGRLLRYVVANDRFINYELVLNGYAHAYSYPPDVSCLDTLLRVQREARESASGLWSVTPVP